MIDKNNTIFNNPNYIDPENSVFDGPGYSDNYKLDQLIQNDHLVSAAIEATNNAPEDQIFEVRATVPVGAKVIQKDDEGVQKVSNTVLVATFDNKTEAKEFAATLNKAIDGDEEAVREVGKWETNFNDDYEQDIRGLTAAIVQPFTMSNSSLNSYDAGNLGWGYGIPDLNIGGVEGQLNNFSNSAVLENLLTQNSPTINIPMVMEELCEFVLSDDPNEGILDKIWSKIKKFFIKLFYKILNLLVKIIANIIQKIRKMIAAKIKQFLAEYVADACLSGLGTAIAEFENPANLLDLEELFDSMLDGWESLCKTFWKIIDEIKDLWSALYTPVQKTIHADATERKAYWAKKWEEILAFVNRAICGRTKAFAEHAQQNLNSAIEDQIKGFMQGCLFQQALKSAKKFAPDSIPTDIMNRISNLTQKGQMMDAYNIALAAGVDLQSKNFRIELPYAGGWVNEIYGDPYVFKTEKFNPSQTAKWVMEGVPTVGEMMTEIPPEKMQNSWVADNWTKEDQKNMAVFNTLEDKIEDNTENIEGAEKLGDEMSYITASATYAYDDDGNMSISSVDGDTITSPMVKEVDRANRGVEENS